MNFNSPSVEKRIVCISSNYILSAEISSFFNEEKNYFVVLEAPSLKKYWENDVIKLNNVISRISPDQILLIDLTSQTTEYIKNQLKIPESRYIHLNKRSQIKNLFSEFNLDLRGVLKCPPIREKVCYALLEAKRKRLQLVITSKSTYEIKIEKKKDHLICSDSLRNLNPVHLANYAFAVDSDIQLFEEQENYSGKEMLDVIQDTDLDNSRGNVARNAKDEIKSLISLNLNQVNSYKFITFFTSSFFYGYFFQQIPSTHILNTIILGYFLADSISERTIKVFSALLVDPGFFSDSETDNISDLLAQKNVFTRELRDNQFNNVDLDNSIQFFPYDFLYICSHAGFINGTRFRIDFLDSRKCEHEIIIDTFDAYLPTNRGGGVDRIIEIQSFYEFVELDKQPWYQKEYKKGSSKTVVEDFLKIGRSNWNIRETSEVDLKNCNVIFTKDPLGPYLPAIHGISDPESTPFIFNNACISSYTMGSSFISAGAAFYIGTVKSTKDSDAKKIGELYFEKCIKENKPLAISLWETYNELDLTTDENIYVSVGCHFQKFEFPYLEGDINNLMKLRLESSIYKHALGKSKEELAENVKQKHSDAVNFLSQELEKL